MTLLYSDVHACRDMRWGLGYKRASTVIHDRAAFRFVAIKSKSLATVIGDVDEWEKTVEQFKVCNGVISNNDRRTVCLQKLPRLCTVRYRRVSASAPPTWT